MGTKNKLDSIDTLNHEYHTCKLMVKKNRRTIESLNVFILICGALVSVIGIFMNLIENGMGTPFIIIGFIISVIFALLLAFGNKTKVEIQKKL